MLVSLSFQAHVWFPIAPRTLKELVRTKVTTTRELKGSCRRLKQHAAMEINNKTILCTIFRLKQENVPSLCTQTTGEDPATNCREELHNKQEMLVSPYLV